MLTKGGGDKRKHILNFSKRVHIHEGHWYHSQQVHDLSLKQINRFGNNESEDRRDYEKAYMIVQLDMGGNTGVESRVLTRGGGR